MFGWSDIIQNTQTVELEGFNKSFQWGSKYARGLVVLNKTNKDRIAHLWWGIMVIANSLIYVIPKNDIFWMTLLYPILYLLCLSLQVCDVDSPRAETICPAHNTIQYGAHDTICSVIHLPFLAGKQRLVITACDQKHHTQPTTAACAVMMCSGYNNGGLLRVPDAVRFWWIYSCYWNILVVICSILCSFLTLVCVKNVPYRIVSSSERIVIHTVASVSLVYWCAGVSFQP